MKALRLTAATTALGCIVMLTGCSSSSSGKPMFGSSGSAGAGVPKSSNGASMPVSTGGSTTVTGGAVSGTGDVCKRLEAASKQLGTLSSAANDPTTAKAAFEKAIAAYQQIGAGAPADVQKAVNDLVAVMKNAETIYGGGTPDPTKISGLYTNLAKDGEVVALYLEKNCAGG